MKQTLSDRSLHARGVRDTARGLRISTDTMRNALTKQEAVRESVHTTLWKTMPLHEIPVDIARAGEAARDAMGCVVGNKGHQRWRWQAIAHQTGAVLASVCGRRKDAVFLQLKALLEPCSLTRFSTDPWGAYIRHLDPEGHRPGQRNTEKIARKPLPLRTRLTRWVRKTICVSKTLQMHDIVIGLCVNRSAFGLLVYNGHLHF